MAEEIVFGKNKITIGASDDIKRATELCRNMITKWGMSDKLGPFVVNQEVNQSINLYYEDQKNIKISEKTARLVDDEIKALINKTYKNAVIILSDNLEKLHQMAVALLQYETIDAEQINKIMNR